MLKNRIGEYEKDICAVLSQVCYHIHPRIVERIQFRNEQDRAVLIIEDDPRVCDLLDLLLKDQGCHTATAPDGIAALHLVARGKIRPDLILADYNLPKGLDGLQFVEKVRAQLHRHIPVIVLTGDISTSTLRDIARHDCVQLNKPVRLKELTQAVQRLLPASRSAGNSLPVPLPTERSNHLGQVIFVIDDDSHIRDGLRKALQAAAVFKRGTPWSVFSVLPRSAASHSRAGHS